MGDFPSRIRRLTFYLVPPDARVDFSILNWERARNLKIFHKRKTRRISDKNLKMHTRVDILIKEKLTLRDKGARKRPLPSDGTSVPDGERRSSVRPGSLHSLRAPIVASGIESIEPVLTLVN